MKKKKMWQQCLVSAVKTSHGRFYYSVLQDLVLLLKGLINSQPTELPLIPSAHKVSLERQGNSVFVLHPAA